MLIFLHIQKDYRYWSMKSQNILSKLWLHENRLFSHVHKSLCLTCYNYLFINYITINIQSEEGSLVRAQYCAHWMNLFRIQSVPAHGNLCNSFQILGVIVANLNYCCSEYFIRIVAPVVYNKLLIRSIFSSSASPASSHRVTWLGLSGVPIGFWFVSGSDLGWDYLMCVLLSGCYWNYP